MLTICINYYIKFYINSYFIKKISFTSKSSFLKYFFLFLYKKYKMFLLFFLSAQIGSKTFFFKMLLSIWEGLTI